MASTDDILFILKNTAQRKIEQRGVKVYVKTNLGPEVLAYDSDAPESEGSGLIKAGVILRDRDGDELASYGGYPKTNVLIVVSFVVIVLGLVFFLLRGLIR